MAGERNEYELGIKTKADLSGAQAGKKSLDELTKGFEAAAKAAGEVNAATSKSSQAMDQGAKTAKQAAQDVKDLTENLKQLKAAQAQISTDAFKDAGRGANIGGFKSDKLFKQANRAGEKAGAATGAAAEANEFINSLKATEQAIPGHESLLAGLGNTVKELGQSYRQAGGGIEGMFAVLSDSRVKAIGAIAIGLKGVQVALSGATAAVKEYAEAEKSAFKLDAALAVRGQLTDAYREKLHALSKQMQDDLRIDGDVWVEAMAKLTAFGADEGSIGKRLKDVENLAGLMGGDVTGAANMMSKAMQGNFQMLERFGISARGAKTEVEKLEMVSQQLSNRGAGLLKASMSGVSGSMAEVKLRVKDTVEEVGKFIVKTGVVDTMLNITSTLFRGLSRAIEGTTPRASGLTNAVTSTVQAFDELAESNAKKTLEQMAEQAEKAAKNLQLVTDRMKEITASQNELANEKMAYDLAVIDDQEKSGKLSKPQAIMARAGIKRKYQIEEYNREQDLAQAEIYQNQRELSRIGNTRGLRERERDRLKGMLPEAEALQVGRAKLARFEARTFGIGETISELEATQRVADATGAPGPDAQLAEARKALEDSKREEEGLRSYLSDLAKSIPAEAKSVDELTKAIKSLEAAIAKDREEAKPFKQANEQLFFQAGQRERKIDYSLATQGLGAMGEFRDALKEATEAQAKAALEAVKAGLGPPTVSRDIALLSAAIVSAERVKNQDIKNALETMLAAQRGFSDELKRLAAENRQNKSQIKAGLND